jgi:proteic killer suppression protein
MIEDFKHRGLKWLFDRGSTRGLPAEQVPKIRRILHQLSLARTLDDMRVPGWKLHELSGKRKGTWAVWVTGNYRVTFDFEEGSARNVNYEDYH